MILAEASGTWLLLEDGTSSILLEGETYLIRDIVTAGYATGDGIGFVVTRGYGLVPPAPLPGGTFTADEGGLTFLSAEGGITFTSAEGGLTFISTA